ncbi:MAG: succinylglutamate desuccinylase/aspartoacylase family protein [Patescibacteria group bacterium]
MFEEIFELNGNQNGNTSIILAGVHGNEKPGIEALQKVLTNLEIKRGRVLIGYGNPTAMKTNQRFIQADLNRMFKPNDLLSDIDMESDEYARAQFLKNYLNQAGALLDIHSSATPESRPFIICEANAESIIEYLPIDLVVSGFDQVQPGGTDYFMNSLGKIGICVECGYIGNPESSLIAENSIIAFLKARGHLTNDLGRIEKSYIRMSKLYKTTSDCFTLSKPFADFEKLDQNQIIGKDGDKLVRADNEGVILFARNHNKIGEEAFLLGTMYSPFPAYNQ